MKPIFYLYAFFAISLVLVGVMGWHWSEVAKTPFWWKFWQWAAIAAIIIFVLWWIKAFTSQNKKR